MARINPRRRSTKRFCVGDHLPVIDVYDRINERGVNDLVRAALPYLDANDRGGLGLGDQSDGEKAGEDFEIGKFVPSMDQQQTFDLVYAALPYLDEAEIFRLMADELSPAGRERLIRYLQDCSLQADDEASA